VRVDGRGPDQMRPLKMTPDFISTAEGSVLIEIGSTRVICTATVDDGVPGFMKGTGKGWVTSEYGMLPTSSSIPNLFAIRRRPNRYIYEKGTAT